MRDSDPGGERRPQPDDRRAAGVSAAAERAAHSRRTTASGRARRTARRSGGAASTSIASAAWRSRCSRSSTCRIRTSPAGARNVSTVPTQALTLLNNEFVLRQAQLFADRVKKEAGDDPAKQIDLAYRIALTRPPTRRRSWRSAHGVARRTTHVLLTSIVTARAARTLNEFRVRAGERHEDVQDVLVETRFSVSLRRRHQRPGAGVPAEPGQAAGGEIVNAGACDADADRVQSLRAEAAALQAAREGGDLAVHERRRQPHRHVRSQAGADQVRRTAARRQGGRRRRAAGPSRAADAEPVHVQEVRAERHGGVGAVPAHRRARRRARVRAVGLRQIERSRAGALRDADRADPHGVPERRLVGHLRARLGEREPAGVRRDLRRARRPARRRQRLERRLHAGGLPGHALPLDRRSDRRSEAARRRQRRSSSAPGSTCWRS